MTKQAYDWKLRLARELWRDVRDVPGLAWTGHGQPVVLAVGDEGLALKLWPEGALEQVGIGGAMKLEVKFDRVVVCGALEAAPDGALLLEQVSRVVRPDGKVLLVVANRMSPWVWWPHSPWGDGRPYSKDQLEAAVKAAGMKVELCRYGVLVPPSRWATIWRLRGLWRTLAAALFPAFGGVIVLVACREVGGAKGLKIDADRMGVTAVPVGVSLRVRKGAGA